MLRKILTALLLCTTLVLVAQVQAKPDPVYWWLDWRCNKDCRAWGLPSANVHGAHCAFPTENPNLKACYGWMEWNFCAHATECRVLRMIRPLNEPGSAVEYQCDCLYQTNVPPPNYNTNRVPCDDNGNPLIVPDDPWWWPNGWPW